MTYKEQSEIRYQAILKLEAKIQQLEKENAEQIEQLTKAKEIIRGLLNSCFGYNSKTVNYEVKVKAEQFLKEVAEDERAF